MTVRSPLNSQPSSHRGAHDDEGLGTLVVMPVEYKFGAVAEGSVPKTNRCKHSQPRTVAGENPAFHTGKIGAGIRCQVHLFLLTWINLSTEGYFGCIPREHYELVTGAALPAPHSASSPCIVAMPSR